MRQVGKPRARASLANTQAVQQAAGERLHDGLATLPDVLEARSATAIRLASFDCDVGGGGNGGALPEE